MAHNIDFSNDRANIAFLGSRNDVWHRLGQEMKPGQTSQEWADAAGLGWHAVKVPVFAQLSGPEFNHLSEVDRAGLIEDRKAIVRSDTGVTLGIGSDQYQPHQPAEVLDWFQKYVGVDDRFVLDTAGSLKGGKIIWAQAKFRDELSVVGEAHTAKLLMTTTFDASGSTINKATLERVVCNNTLDAALADGGKSIIRTRHNTAFNAERVSKELAAIAQGFEKYKAMAEAMVQVHQSREDVAAFFKTLLDIPHDAKKADISTRKANQYEALRNAYVATIEEGTQPSTNWTALNAVTRWVDHDRASKNASDEARVLSSAFGSGAEIKAKAVRLLVPELA